jgi:hypothetical protein
MKKCITAMLLAVAVIAMPIARADEKIADVTDMQALRDAVKSDKKAFVTSLLKLNAAESKKFWPVYDTYQRDLDLANRQRNLALVALVGLDRPISDLYAKNLAKDLFNADEAETKARRTLYNRLMKPLPGRSVIPPVKAARYLQLESKIRAVQAYDIASTIPLVK